MITVGSITSSYNKLVQIGKNHGLYSLPKIEKEKTTQTKQTRYARITIMQIKRDDLITRPNLRITPMLGQSHCPFRYIHMKTELSHCLPMSSANLHTSHAVTPERSRLVSEANLEKLTDNNIRQKLQCHSKLQAKHRNG